MGSREALDSIADDPHFTSQTPFVTEIDNWIGVLGIVEVMVHPEAMLEGRTA